MCTHTRRVLRAHNNPFGPSAPSFLSVFSIREQQMILENNQHRLSSMKTFNFVAAVLYALVSSSRANAGTDSLRACLAWLTCLSNPAIHPTCLICLPSSLSPSARDTHVVTTHAPSCRPYLLPPKCQVVFCCDVTERKNAPPLQSHGARRLLRQPCSPPRQRHVSHVETL